MQKKTRRRPEVATPVGAIHRDAEATSGQGPADAGVGRQAATAARVGVGL